MNAYLLLANGMVFAGQSVGAQGVTVGEVVFATGGVVDPATRELRIYYGGADTTLNLATGNVDEIVEWCLKGE